VPQSDDGVVIAHGQLAGKPDVTMAIEGAFQGGNLGEVSASKIAGALALERRACERGNRLNNADARGIAPRRSRCGRSGQSHGTRRDAWPSGPDVAWEF
jgi:hypothetical protein